MRNLTRILALCLTLFSVRAAACELSNGKLSFQKVDSDTYKIFLRQQPTNTCFNYDSIRFSVTLRCKMTGAIEKMNVGLHDTLTYDVDGVVILEGSIRWYFGGNWIVRSFSSQCFGTGNGCFEKVPDLPPTLPPSILPEISIQNGLFSSNVGGVLIMVDLASYNAIVKEFTDAFQYQIPSGQWLVYLQLFDGTTIGQQIIQIP